MRHGYWLRSEVCNPLLHIVVCHIHKIYGFALENDKAKCESCHTHKDYLMVPKTTSWYYIYKVGRTLMANHRTFYNFDICAKPMSSSQNIRHECWVISASFGRGWGWGVLLLFNPLP